MKTCGDELAVLNRQSAVALDRAAPTTPVTEDAVRALFEGLALMHPTMERGAPGKAAVAVTPGLAGLLEQFCSKDSRYMRVMANVFILEYADIKRNMIL